MYQIPPYSSSKQGRHHAKKGVNLMSLQLAFQDGFDDEDIEKKNTNRSRYYTKKDLYAILRDFEIISQLVDDVSRMDIRFPTGFLTKEQRSNWCNKQTEKFYELRRTGGISTCAGIGLINLIIEDSERLDIRRRNKSIWYGVDFLDSEEAHPFLDKSYSIADLISDIKIAAIRGSTFKLGQLKSTLELCESYVECLPRAFNSELLEEAKGLVFDSDNLSDGNSSIGKIRPKGIIPI